VTKVPAQAWLSFESASRARRVTGAAARIALLCAIVVPAAACAHLKRPFDIAPNGLPRQEARVRDWLATGRADSAFARLSSANYGPGDDLLHALFAGAAAHYAGEWDSSALHLERAVELAEDRATKSVSRSALSLVVNDFVLPYEPTRTERLFIPYYAALSRLRSNDLAGAVVEARRLADLLERCEADGWQGDAGLRAAMRYLSAAIFDAAGERNDALVAYRNAAALDADLVVHTDTAWSERPDSGEVVVIVEHGYVAHRAPESLNVLLAPHEVHGLRHGDDEHRASFTALVAERVLAGRPPPRLDEACTSMQPCTGEADGRNGDGKARDDDDYDDDEPYLIRVAWPVMRRSSFVATAADITIAGMPSLPARAEGDVTASVIADFRSELPLIVGRTIARAAIKAALAREAKQKAKKKDDDAGRIVGVLANAGGALLEQADTRSWHLLPARISVARMRVPAGSQSLVIEANGNRVEMLDGAERGVGIISIRIW
jgi:hypothetical protein